MSSFNELMSKARQGNEYWESLVQNKIAIQISNILSCKGLSQADFAKVAGVSPAYISRVLGGNENLSIKTMVKLTRAIGASLDVSVSLGLPSFAVEPHKEKDAHIQWRELQRIAHKKHGSPKFRLSIPQEAGNENIYRTTSVVETIDRFASAA